MTDNRLLRIHEVLTEQIDKVECRINQMADDVTTGQVLTTYEGEYDGLMWALLLIESKMGSNELTQATQTYLDNKKKGASNDGNQDKTAGHHRGLP